MEILIKHEKSNLPGMKLEMIGWYLKKNIDEKNLLSVIEFSF